MVSKRTVYGVQERLQNAIKELGSLHGDLHHDGLTNYSDKLAQIIGRELLNADKDLDYIMSCCD